MRIFAKEWVSNLLQRLGMEEGVPIESKMITRRIEAAQKAVEGQNFEARKHLLEYDDVMNKQRQAVYGLRRQLLEGIDQKELILRGLCSRNSWRPARQVCRQRNARRRLGHQEPEEPALHPLRRGHCGRGHRSRQAEPQELGDAIFDKLKERYDAKEQLIGPDAMRHHERIIMLSVLDQQWKDHLLSMDHLREGIGLRGYGQHDPLVEYKRESFDMFEAMMERFEEETVRYLYLMQVIEAPGAVDSTTAAADRLTAAPAAVDCRPGRSGAGRVAATGNRRAGRACDFHGRHGRSLPAPQAPRTGAGAHGR